MKRHYYALRNHLGADCSLSTQDWELYQFDSKAERDEWVDAANVQNYNVARTVTTKELYRAFSQSRLDYMLEEAERIKERLGTDGED